MDCGSATEADSRFMRRALALAERGWGRVHPNPLVGAVIVRGNEVVGEGFHQEFGGPHAEVAALEAAGERARNAVLYVTLEPCAHEGKTPPCTTAIRSAGIRRVVYAAADPGEVSGGGAERLRNAGVEVVGGVEETAARSQNAAFFHIAETGRPFVALKLAISLDARIAAREGEATRITGPLAAEEAHRLRAGYDAVLVGIRTVLTDDPLLTVRGRVVPRIAPARVVMDTEARLAPGSRLLQTVDDAPVHVLCAENAAADRTAALETAGARVTRIPRGGGGLDLNAALERLHEQGVSRIFCEGGGRIASGLLSLDRIERMYLFYAPRILGSAAVPAFPGPAGHGRWRRVQSTAFSPDILLVYDRDH